MADFGMKKSDQDEKPHTPRTGIGLLDDGYIAYAAPRVLARAVHLDRLRELAAMRPNRFVLRLL